MRGREEALASAISSAFVGGGGGGGGGVRFDLSASDISDVVSLLDQLLVTRTILSQVLIYVK